MKHTISIALALFAAPAMQCLAERLAEEDRLADDLHRNQGLCAEPADCTIVDSYDDLLVVDSSLALLGMHQIELIQETYQEPFPYASALISTPISTFQNSLSQRDRWIQVPEEPDISMSVIRIIEELSELSNDLDSVNDLPPPEWSSRISLDAAISSIRAELLALTTQLESLTFLPIPEPRSALMLMAAASASLFRQRD